MDKFEYKIVRGIGKESKLNELGEEGWELCGISNEGFGGAFIFKRQKRSGDTRE